MISNFDDSPDSFVSFEPDLRDPEEELKRLSYRPSKSCLLYPSVDGLCDITSSRSQLIDKLQEWGVLTIPKDKPMEFPIKPGPKKVVCLNPKTIDAKIFLSNIEIIVDMLNSKVRAG